MAKVIHVNKAQQRYVTDPVTKQRTGQIKPLEVCDYDQQPIEVGSSYKHITIKTGQRSSRRYTRHENCPNWHSWELRNTVSARAEKIAHDFGQELNGVDSVDDVRAALDSAADEIDGLAEEKRESAANIVDGFGHETEQSSELESTAEELDAWAEELRSYDIPDEPVVEDEECPECEGNTEVENPDYDDEDEDSEETIPCDECEGSGCASEVSEESWDAWREDIAGNCGIDNNPV